MSLIPGNQTVMGNLTVAGDIVTFGNQVPTDPFGEMITTQRTCIIDLKSVFGISALRDQVTITPSNSFGASVSNVPGNPEYYVSSGTDANSFVDFASSERGTYVAGYGAEVGIAVRFPAGLPLTGNQKFRFGYFDLSSNMPYNGFYYEITSNNALSVNVIRGGAPLVTVAQSDWNVDKLDGTGASRATLDLTKGNIFKFAYSWYGYGAIVFGVVLNDAKGNQWTQNVHKYVPIGSTSIYTPFLNLRITMENGGTANANRYAYIAGRQYSIYGGFTPNFRLNSVYRALGTVSASSTVYIMAARRKQNYAGNVIRIEGIDVATGNGDVILQIRSLVPYNGVTPTITGGTWNAPDDQPASESAVEVNTTLTDVGTAAGSTYRGVVVWSGYIGGGSKGSTSINSIKYNLTETYPIVVVVKPIVNSSVSIFLRWAEEW